MSFPFFPKKSFYQQKKPLCIGSDKFLSGSLTHELTFRMHWNNIECATSPAWCELQHQCIYKQCITGKFASRPPDHPGRHSGSPGSHLTVFVQHWKLCRVKNWALPIQANLFLNLLTILTFSYFVQHVCVMRHSEKENSPHPKEQRMDRPSIGPCC